MGNEIIELIHDDCLQAMRNIEDSSIDMVLCDLPYGTTNHAWDVILDLDELWKQYKRIVKSGAAVLLFTQMPFACILGMSNIRQLRYEWIYEKGNATGFLNCNKMPMKAHENILVFYDKLPTYNPQKEQGKSYGVRVHTEATFYRKLSRQTTINTDGKRYPRDVIYCKNPHNGLLHPTAKLTDICEYMIKTYTNKGETVLDNCMGSGTTGIAALKTGRNFIGIEKDKHYFDVACEQIYKLQKEIKNEQESVI